MSLASFDKPLIPKLFAPSTRGRTKADQAETVKAMSRLSLLQTNKPDRSHRVAIRALAGAARSVMSGLDVSGNVGESRLTPSGDPAELAFLWPGPDYRISLDPCPGASAETRLLTCTEVVLQSLSPAQREIHSQISGWQQQYGARYGAWLGLRLRNGEVAHKLYLDIPGDAPWAIWEEGLAGTRQIRSARGAVATMVGLDPMTGGTEIYFSSGKLHPGDLPALAARIGLKASADTVPALVQDLTRRSVRFALPSYDMGFSNAWDRDGSAIAFTWYSTSVGLLGPDARARAALLSAGHKRSWEMSAFADLTPGTPPRRAPR